MTTKKLLHIFIVTAESPQKCTSALESFWQDMVEGVQVTVLAANTHAATVTAWHQRFPGLTLGHHPGESVWHLRRRIGELTQNSHWMLLLEDHNVPLSGWLPRLMDELQCTDESVSAIFGSTDNLTSTEPWDWANFLAVQVFHWAPGVVETAHPLPFNAAMRVSQLPSAPWLLGTFEAVAVGQVSYNSRSSSAFVVDHIQPRSFPSVLSYHFFNGQATGAHLRSRQTRPLRQIAAHTVHVLLVRPVRSARVISRHPKRGVLPKGTWWRLPVLLGAHAIGAWVGFVAGPGHSMWQLE